jgi:FdhD protein
MKETRTTQRIAGVMAKLGKPIHHEALRVADCVDIGRHNALDKAIGKCLLMQQATRGCGVVLSGRVSLEMITKAARAGVEPVVAIAGVSSYAIAAALRWNITLCGFVRHDRINIYTDPTRIRRNNNGRYAHAG